MKSVCRISLAALSLLIAACAAEPVPALPAMKLDPSRVAVAGFSSGAYMAQQVHVAYSDRIVGAALLAGGPYHCAEGALQRALGTCIKSDPAPPDVDALARIARARAQRGEIADLAGLAGDRVLVVHGRADSMVAGTVTRASAAIYEALGSGLGVVVESEFDGEFAHVFPTLDAGGDCATTAAPFVGRCGIDLAGRMMSVIFGPPPQAAAPAAAGALEAFDQSSLQAPDSDAFLDRVGYLYRPAQCSEAGRCGLLIAFHGCEQNAANVQQSFAHDSGFNRWADVHGVVVLYPQTRSTYMPLNPKACWDWWGFSGPGYDTRDGVQLRWVANAAAVLGVPLDSR